MIGQPGLRPRILRAVLHRAYGHPGPERLCIVRSWLTVAHQLSESQNLLWWFLVGPFCNRSELATLDTVIEFEGAVTSNIQPDRKSDLCERAFWTPVHWIVKRIAEVCFLATVRWNAGYR